MFRRNAMVQRVLPGRRNASESGWLRLPTIAPPMTNSRPAKDETAERNLGQANFPVSEWRNRSDTMCDYSLEHVESRPAKVGDQLVSTVFSNSITRGFAEEGNPQVAVCLMPGTELVFDRDVECDHALGFFPTKKMGENTARFRRINPDRPHEHHDALEFPSGRIVLLTRLVAGQRATVLQLPVGAPEHEPKLEAEPVSQPGDELMPLP
jgi:hypothetical protein